MAKTGKGPVEPATASTAPARRDPRWPIVLILLFSVAVGFIAVLQFQQSPFHQRPVLDEVSYFNWAVEIADGDWLGKKVFYQDPLYPYFLAVIFRVMGPRIGAVRLVQVLLGAWAVWIVYAAGRKVNGYRTGLIAAGMLAMCGSLYFFEILLLKATLVILLCAGSIYFGISASSDPRRRLPFFGAGLSLGLLSLLRGNFIGLIPFAALWAAAIAPHGWRARLSGTAALIAGAAVIIAPVTIRNFVVGGELILTTSQAGANFYIGNNADAPGYYGVIPFVRADPLYEADDFRAEAERRTGRSLRPSEVSNFWLHEGLRWIIQNPGPATRVTLHKARLLIHQFEVPDNYSFGITRDNFTTILKIPFLGIGWLWGPAMAGVFLLRRNRQLWYPAGFGILYAASIIPFFIVDRYRTPLLAPAALLAACLVAEAGRIVRSRDFRGTVIAGIMLAAGLGLGLGPIPESSTIAPIAAYNVGNAWFEAGNYRESIRWYQITLEQIPGHVDALNNLKAARKMLEAENAPTQ